MVFRYLILWSLDDYRNEESENALLGCSGHFLANVDIGYSVVQPIFPI